MKLMKLVLCVFILFATGSCKSEKYPSGRDTYRSFGDGRFQILVGYRDGVREFTLFDGEKQDTIIYNLISFNENRETVYGYGTDWTHNKRYYVILNYGTGKQAQFTNLTGVPIEQRQYFQKLQLIGINN